MKLLENGEEREQLSSCNLSLLLGVLTPDNAIADFLHFACQHLKMANGLWLFKQEPYGWYFSQQRCQACRLVQQHDLESLLYDTAYIDQYHTDYQTISHDLNRLGIIHRRFVLIALKYQDQIIGQVILFDEHQHHYDSKQLPVVLKFIKNLMHILELRQECSELKEVYEQQSALNFSKTKFFQIIAHDLRAPFHGLLGFSEVLAKERHTLEPAGIQDIADYLFDTAQSTYNLLESLLNWAMAEGGRFVCHPINFDLFQSSQIVMDVLGGLAVNKNIKLINKIPQNTNVYADINMITSVLQNLVSNALKFTPVDCFAEVILSAKERKAHIDVSVYDRGLGMSKAQIERLFEPKLTVGIKQGTDGEKGAGLGLVLCKRFIDLNQGHISVVSQEGQGTVFKVSLPKAHVLDQALV